MARASERATKAARAVLAKIAAYDGQFLNPNPTTLMAWAEHISLRNMSEEEMLEAVTKFYETNDGDVRPLPASISNIAMQLRQDRNMRESDDVRRAREDAHDARLEEENRQLAMANAKPRGTYVNDDPAGWTYGNALTQAEREAARIELDARIDVWLRRHPGKTRTDAEIAIRTGDRERAERILATLGRRGDVAGAIEQTVRSFSEPIHGGED